MRAVLLAPPCRAAVASSWRLARPLASVVTRPLASNHLCLARRLRSTSAQPDVDETARHVEQVHADDLIKKLPLEARQRLYHALLTNDTNNELSEDPIPHPHEVSSAPPITKSQYVKLVIRTGAPFVMFGFIDNTIMIVCGLPRLYGLNQALCYIGSGR